MLQFRRRAPKLEHRRLSSTLLPQAELQLRGARYGLCHLRPNPAISLCNCTCEARMSDNISPAPLGQPTQIDIRAIERELNELWRQATDGQNGDKPHSATRTRVLSLIVVTRGNAEAEHATEIIAKLNL